MKKQARAGASANGYQFRYTDVIGKRKYTYSGDLASLREKEKQIERDLPMMDTARRMLFRQKELNMMYGKRKEVEGYDDYFFLNSQGSPLIVSTLDKILKLIITDYNKEHPEKPLPIISMHILRHSYLTRSAEAGMDAKVLQYLAGHESITTTMNVYVNYDYDQIRKQAVAVQEKVKFG